MRDDASPSFSAPGPWSFRARNGFYFAGLWPEGESHLPPSHEPIQMAPLAKLEKGRCCKLG